ncbi:hypothetical protein [Methylobacterium sp. SD21]|uniref:hypothetical protein n=1 Tax=Methylobacterium litchii TaxID=3138810 RepID=UPI00313E7459
MLDLLSNPHLTIWATAIIVGAAASHCTAILSTYLAEAARTKRDQADAARDVGRAALIAAHAYAARQSAPARDGGFDDGR